jgi:hypothetical protein
MTSKEYNRKWREDNKEKIRETNAAWRNKNRDKINSKQREYRKINPPKQTKLNFYVVYSLMSGYVGKTNNPYRRMASHKHNGKDVEGWFILAITKTNEEAKKLEREYHLKGAPGHRYGTPLTDEQKIKNRKAIIKKYNNKTAKNKKLAKKK